MLDYFRDPVWQFVGAILALVALAATVIIYALQRQKKRLSYELISRNQLLTVREELESKLQVIYDGQPARDICLIVVKIYNSGNVAVTSSDYERELSINTGVSSKILSAAITEVEPDNLSVGLSVNEADVHIAPTLLNPRDSMSLKLLVSDFGGRISVDGRVVGVRKIEDTNSSRNYDAVLIAVAMLAVLGGFFLMAHFTPEPEVTPPWPIQAKAGLVLVAISYIAMVYLVVRKRRFVRMFRRFLGGDFG